MLPGPDVAADAADVRPVEIAHLALGWRAVSVSDDDRFALALLNHVFGSGPSSRLFQEVRESRGLTYSISSGVSHHVDAGALSVHCASAVTKVDDLLVWSTTSCRTCATTASAARSWPGPRARCGAAS